MSRATAPLSDAASRSAKPTDRAYKLFDGDGLYLLVQPNGQKGWRLRYVKPDGREGLTSFGNYPIVGLADARRKRLEVKRMLADGIDPIGAKNQAKADALIKGRTFESVALGCTRNVSQVGTGLFQDSDESPQNSSLPADRRPIYCRPR